MNARRRYFLLALAGAVFAGALSMVGLSMGGRDTKTIHLAGQEFRVPVRNLADNVPLWLRLLPGLRDDSNAVNLQFTAAELRHIRGFDWLNDQVVFVTLSVVGKAAVEMETMQWAAAAADIWQGYGRYEGRTLEPVDGTSLMRAHMAIDKGRRWNLLREVAEGGMPRESALAASYIGGCHTIRDGRGTSCVTGFRFDDVTLTMSLSEGSLTVIDDIQIFFEDRVRAWRQP